MTSIKISFLYKPLRIFKFQTEQIQVLPFLAKITHVKGVYIESMSEKIIFAHPQSTSLLALINRNIHIYLRKYVWNGQKYRNQIYILSETFLVKPKLHTTTEKGGLPHRTLWPS